MAHKRKPKQKRGKRAPARSTERAAFSKAVEQLNSACAALAPSPGSSYRTYRESIPASFEGLPLLPETKQGLAGCGYEKLTEVQRAVLPHALARRDVLGAARTGSGKTLAFVVPIVERLVRLSWGEMDGCGALVITPTRELALQIFNVISKVARHHALTVGLIVGGKDVDIEKSRISLINVIIATPGRLLQHMDETAGFNMDSLEVLVLDEADRILDMGFEKELAAIIRNLPGPEQRQCLLFSATQTRSVKQLARLSLNDPEFISVHEDAPSSTPKQLDQYFMEVPLPQKIDTLFSFIRSHPDDKIIVFASACRQVKMLAEFFHALRCGLHVLSLHGKMKQDKRIAVYDEFCRTEHAVLFCTDVASRGLDFPKVTWVVQFDCPEDVAMYIHRAGRTARYTSKGKALLMLLPSERAMVEELTEAKVPITEIFPNPDKVVRTSPKLQEMLAKDKELYATTQRALVAYMRSIWLQPNKKVFDISKLPCEDYAFSLGLPGAPRLRFVTRNKRELGGEVFRDKGDGGKKDEKGKGRKEGKKHGKREKGSSSTSGSSSSGSSSASSSSSSIASYSSSTSEKAPQRPRGRMDRLFKKRGAELAPTRPDKLRTAESSDSESDLVVVKRKDHTLNEPQSAEAEAADQELLRETRETLSRSKRRKLMAKNPQAGQSRIVFDDDGKVQGSGLAVIAAGPIGPVGDSTKEFIERKRALMRAADLSDREKEKERVRAMHEKKRKRAKEERTGRKAGEDEDEGDDGDDDDEDLERMSQDSQVDGGSDDGGDYGDADGDDDEGSDNEDVDYAAQEALALKLLSKKK